MPGWNLQRWTMIVLAGVLGQSQVAPAPALAAAPLKLATLVPEGSIWDRDLRAMGDQWQRETGGRVSLRIYAGGVAGSESDILRKMRIGQLHAATITLVGLADIDPDFEVLGIPMFYESFAEFLYILDGLEPELKARLEAKGYAFVAWGHGGWVRFFSRAPILRIDDLRKQKIFVTAGSDETVALWKDNGFHPVPLAQTDIMTGFQTGMIDVLGTTPLAALSLQWFRQASHMSEVGLAPLTGATIVNLRDWNKIDAADRVILLRDADAYEKRQRETIPEQDQVAIDEMSRRGLEVTSSADPQEWNETASRMADSMRGRTVPPEIYDAAEKLRAEFRARKEASPSAAAPADAPAGTAGATP
ncbi:MAG: TRAP transporter substrate-binding protein DctP [Acidobacteriota bacterium]|nr:TRAP transporter substrate-binding protein DctP [Acidobacteriota bacterium]